jgi:hypothetical protein
MRSTMGFAAVVAGGFAGLPVLLQAQAGPENPAHNADSIADATASRRARQERIKPGGRAPAVERLRRLHRPRQPVTAAMETETTVENEQYKIVFTNRGAQVKHWILKKYNDTAGKPLDMVQPQAAAQFGLPLSLFTYEPALTSQLNQALYQVTVEGAQPSATGVVLAPTSLDVSTTRPTAGCGEDLPLRLELCDRRRDPGAAQWRAGARAGAVAGGLGDMEEFLPSSPRAARFGRLPTSPGRSTASRTTRRRAR